MKDFHYGKELTREAVEEIFLDKRETLRLILSKAASIYDPSGILSGRMNQLRVVVRTATVYSREDYNTAVPETMWQHFIDCYMEMLKCSVYKYPRLRFWKEITDGLLQLIILVDAADGTQIICLHHTPHGPGQTCQ